MNQAERCREVPGPLAVPGLPCIPGVYHRFVPGSGSSAWTVPLPLFPYHPYEQGGYRLLQGVFKHPGRLRGMGLKHPDELVPVTPGHRSSAASLSASLDRLFSSDWLVCQRMVP